MAVSETVQGLYARVVIVGYPPRAAGAVKFVLQVGVVLFVAIWL